LFSLTERKARLRIAYDVPIPEDVVHNSTTAVSSLSFSVPTVMMGSNGLPKPMEPSWTLCRHIYVSDKIKATGKATGKATAKATTSDSCSFLPPACSKDVKDNLTKNWWKTDPNYPCSELGFDAIAESCQDTFGLARADVIGMFQCKATFHTAESVLIYIYILQSMILNRQRTN
jgi:hypothetical protein